MPAYVPGGAEPARRDMMAAAFILADRTGRVTYMNSEAEQLLGLPASRARGRVLDKILTLLDPESQLPVRLLECMTGNRFFSGARQGLVRHGGGQVPVQCSMVPTRSNENEVAGCVVSLCQDDEVTPCTNTPPSYSMQDDQGCLLQRAELIKRMWHVLQASEAGEPHAFMHLNVEVVHVKGVSEAADHATYDRAIRAVASCMVSIANGRGTVASLGGGAFGLLLEGCPVEQARLRAMKLRQAVASCALRSNGDSIMPAVSIGIAMFNSPNHSLNTILAAADAACCQASREGGDTCLKAVTLD